MPKATKVQLIKSSGTYILRIFSKPRKIFGIPGPDFETVWSGKGLIVARRKGNHLATILETAFEDTTETPNV